MCAELKDFSSILIRGCPTKWDNLFLILQSIIYNG